MSFQNSLSAFGKPDFEDVFEADVGDAFDDLSCLNRLCCNGGWPDELESLTVNDSQDLESELVVNATVFFNESAPTSCAEQNRTYPQAAVVDFRIEKADGSMTADFVEEAFSSDDDDDGPEFDPGLD